MEQNSNVPVMQYNTNNIIQNDSLDCGLKTLGWCSGERCRKLATLRNYVIIFAIVHTIQGIVQTFFRISAQQAGADLGFDPYTVDWLLTIAGLTQGVLGFCLIFYSQRFHPMSWISGFVILESAICVITIIPAVHYLPNMEENKPPIYEPILCDNTKYAPPIEKAHSVVTLVLLFFLQAFISLTGATTYCIGYSYMDDNSKPKDFAILIGVIMMSHICGAQLGSGISLLVDILPFGWWFGWVIIAPLLLIFGILIGLFPRKLIKTIVRQAANLIIQRISQPNLIESVGYVKEYTFFASVMRLLTNKILILNLTAFVFFETALVNYFRQEENYIQSRFYMPTSESNGLLDEWTSRFLLIMLKPPIVGLSILIAGFVVSKLSPSGKRLATWNAIIEIIVCLFFVSYIFIHCSSEKLTNSYKNKISLTYCASNCNCGNDVLFTPVCIKNAEKTYFSPCHAGCQSSVSVNNLMMYEKCSCGANPEWKLDNYTEATSGACNANECQKYWLIYQAMTIMTAVLLGTCEIGRMLITFRSVLPQDKALALALELTLAGIIVNLPGKLAFDYIETVTCEYWSIDSKKCHLQQSPLHGNILNIVSAILFAIAAGVDIMVAIYAKDLNCFTKKDLENDMIRAVPMQDMISRNDQNNSNSYNENNNYSNSQDQHRIPLLRNYEDSSPDSSLLQNSPRRIGGRRSRSPISSQGSIVNPENQNNEISNENVPATRSLSPVDNKLNYAQVMFEFKKKKPPIGSDSVAKEPTAIISSDENLDFRLQQEEQLPTRQDIDADDELSELDSNQNKIKAKTTETFL